MRRKDEEFWEYITKFDIINLTETWMEVKGYEKMRNKLPSEFNGEMKETRRQKIKGTGVGGMIWM